MPPPFRVRVGDCDCWALADGELVYPSAALLPPPARSGDQLSLPYTAVLLNTGSRRVLIDTGAGPLGPETGRLLESLSSAGFAANDVDLIIISHAHPDHIGTLAHFPQAEVAIMRKEYEFWTSEETGAKLAASTLYGLGPLEPLMAGYIRDCLVPARDRMRLLDRPDEVAPGVLVFPAAGHTPGHAAVLISSGRQQLLYVGDAVLVPEQLENPEWVSAFDLSPGETVQTRKELFERAAVDQCIVAGFHLPGAFGAVRMRGTGFRWDPAGPYRQPSGD